MTKASLTEMHATVLTPLALIASMLARNPGTCLALQVGVKAPGRAKATTFLPGANSSSVLIGLGPSAPIMRSVALGTLSPTLTIFQHLRMEYPSLGRRSLFVHSRPPALIFDWTIPMDLGEDSLMSGPSPAATLVGRFLVAAPSMPDERFRKSVVFICKHDDDDGALGIIVNNTVDDLPLGQVYKQLGIEVPDPAAKRPVLFGGPVETSRGLVLHSADYKREETLLIDGSGVGGLALTASLEILKDMADGSGPKEAWLA